MKNAIFNKAQIEMLDLMSRIDSEEELLEIKKVISEEQARLSAQSNVILKALGITPDIEVEIEERPYSKGDRFILCTDGFWGAMPEDEFVRHLSENNPINKILDSTANVVESIGRNSGNESRYGS